LALYAGEAQMGEGEPPSSLPHHPLDDPPTKKELLEEAVKIKPVKRHAEKKRQKKEKKKKEKKRGKNKA
jgi:hypothetical protein